MSRRYLPDTTYSQRELGARRVEQGAGYGAGAVGIGFGASKLRDAYAEEHPASFSRALSRAGAFGLKHRVSPNAVVRAQRVAAFGKPGFKPLAAAAALGTVVTGAKRYRVHNDIQQQKARLGKAAEPVYELGKMPRYAHLKGIGRVHIEHYAGDGHFVVRDRSDSLRKVHRDKLQFVKKSLEETMPTVISAFGVEHEVSKAAPERYTNAKARRTAAARGEALPDGSFPEQTRAQVRRAARMVGHAADPARAAAFTRRRARKLGVSLKGTALDSGVSKSALGVEHEVSKALSDHPAYKMTIWNKDAFGGPHAKENRKILRRARLKGQAAGLTGGAAVGAGAGGLLTHSRKGAVVGGVAGGLVGQLAGDSVGTLRALKNPRYVAKTPKGVSKSAFGVEHEVEKFAVPFTPKAKRQRQQDTELIRTIPRRQAFAAANVPGYIAFKAPKGKKGAAVKTQMKHAFSRPLSGGRAAAAGYARAKQEHGF